MQNKIAIYGAGQFGHRLLQLLRKANIAVACFVQTAKSGQTVLEGLPVMSVDELFEMQESCVIFIAIADLKVRQKVINILREHGYNLSLVFDMYSFIITNREREYYSYTGSRECILCGNRVEKFRAAGESNPIFAEKKIIGGGYRENAVCPCCGSLDRTRWVYWVLKNYTKILEKECTAIHFAPEKQIQIKLEDSDNCDYYAGDVVRTSNLHKIDVTNIPYADKIADYIIINHVMEHVTDEKRAINELKRILKDDGKIIMSFPISMKQKTFEDSSIISDEDRVRYYGQKDHVRLYGTDYKERFEQYGLDIKVFSPKDFLTNEDIEKYGLIREDILLVCSKLKRDL